MSQDILDSMVCVDLTVPPLYPRWMHKVMHPELEATSREKFDPTILKRWSHPGQKNGLVDGHIIYKHLEDTGMLADCLSLRELEEIQKKGIEFFRKRWRREAIFGWKSVIENKDGEQSAPCLVGKNGEVVFVWHWLDYVWRVGNVVLLFVQ